MTAVLTTLGLVLAVVAVLSLGATGPAPGSRSGTAWRRRLASRSGRRCLHGEVLFARCEGDGYVALDCLIESRAVSGGDSDAPGRAPDGRAPVLRPVHVRASGAYLWGVGVSLADVVAGWVAEGRRVPVEIITQGPGQRRLRASTERSVAVLEVADDPQLDQQLTDTSAAA